MVSCQILESRYTMKEIFNPEAETNQPNDLIFYNTLFSSVVSMMHITVRNKYLIGINWTILYFMKLFTA